MVRKKCIVRYTLTLVEFICTLRFAYCTTKSHVSLIVQSINILLFKFLSYIFVCVWKYANVNGASWMIAHFRSQHQLDKVGQKPQMWNQLRILVHSKPCEFHSFHTFLAMEVSWFCVLLKSYCNRTAIGASGADRLMVVFRHSLSAILEWVILLFAKPSTNYSIWIGIAQFWFVQSLGCHIHRQMAMYRLTWWIRPHLNSKCPLFRCIHLCHLSEELLVRHICKQSWMK